MIESDDDRKRPAKGEANSKSKAGNTSAGRGPSTAQTKVPKASANRMAMAQTVRYSTAAQAIGYDGKSC